MLQRRRRLEQDRELIESLRKKSDDLAVLVEWSEAGEAVDAEFSQALDGLDQQVQAAEIKKMLGGEHDRKNAIVTIHPGAGAAAPSALRPGLSRNQARRCAIRARSVRWRNGTSQR